ncbi:MULTISPECIES: DUF4062 domain-containing protein [unclassified Microbacterium]|uniref:DUF4062 domain-containing protein n=1 Tax=unclassified Microbacterium TaxID=2609290 RepID=UPI00214C307F|nr:MULTISPECIES: DUF4062 domain-containing protein [unclassified Microbacterium]MCR2784978.1 DUF4062 domain-containing protein [Microbacterium sp. zg.B96]WIM16517.1 DUF4062 domain-containing protein [Microbacterium sp. zg-B96]
MDAAKPQIRTPDQRIRVFISSTLRELEPERRAVRAVLERLHLAPVMFELGARPHPPRALYRSYLEQSDIFIGLYWERYGWVAPDEKISGLEDEYRLSTALPSLIYIKEPAPKREERLSGLLDAVRSDDRTSYKSFHTPEELADLVLADIATLLAERFDAAEAAAAQVAAAEAAAAEATAATVFDPSPTGSLSIVGAIPAPYSSLVGRETEMDAARALLARPGVRILTLTGPGGVGKSRLAIELALDAATSGRDVAFAALESVTRPETVITVIARALGVRNVGDEPLAYKVQAAIVDRDVLLVVDNMEHLMAASDVLVQLVSGAPRLQLLVTSRSPLRLRAEQVFEVGPLETPEPDTDNEIAACTSAVSLFVQRATAVRPSFRLTPENTPAVIAITRVLDGIPLAIELAAARARILSPQQILARLDSALTLLVDGARDLPDRQRALARTIEWSVDLLDERSRTALGVLAPFSGSFALATAEHVLASAGVDDPFDVLEALTDASLLSRVDAGEIPAFRLLGTVRSYALGMQPADEAERNVQGWIRAYLSLAEDAGDGLRGSDQLEWLARLELEIDNLAAVMRTLLNRHELDAAAEYAWHLYLFLWIAGYLGLVAGWMAELLAAADREDIALTPRSRAIALYYVNAVRFWQQDDYDPMPGLESSRDLFHEVGDEDGAALAGVSVGLAQLARVPVPDVAAATDELERSYARFQHAQDTWGQAMSLVMLGRLDLATGSPESARSRFEQSLALAQAQGERLGIVIAQNHRGWARLLSGDADGGTADFVASFELSVALGHDDGTAYGLETFVAVQAAAGNAMAAGLLLGASQRLRRRTGLGNRGAFDYHLAPLQALRDAGKGEELDAAVSEGLELTVAEVLDRVRP